MAKKNRQDPQQRRAIQERPPSQNIHQDRSQCLTESLLWFSVLFIFCSVTFITVYYLESKSPGKSPLNNSTLSENVLDMSDIPTINLRQVECGSNCLIPAWPNSDIGCHDNNIAITLCADKTRMEGLAFTLFKCGEGKSQCIVYQKKKADPLTCNIHPFEQVDDCTEEVENGSFFILEDKHMKRFPDFFAP
ncbi:predicted protein [Chaetoceros tenuissimus]|uniref:Uncharacterized protein n=1 Tax=Chaetoceros tenuissimus TaxID=426638 RepID=A0AAD3HA13_9STRA|nr:predicted protein [Chaetoceros tenuissimus]